MKSKKKIEHKTNIVLIMRSISFLFLLLLVFLISIDVSTADCLYTRSAGGGGLCMGCGIPSVSCDAGDSIIGVINADCNGDSLSPPVAGNLEWFKIDNSGGNTASIGCDQGDDGSYDGGSITVMCISSSCSNQITNLYTRSGGFGGLAISQGIPSVSCDSGDKVIGVLDADCDGSSLSVAGNMEWVRLNDARTISLGCDQGGDALYDGGQLKIRCLRSACPGQSSNIYTRSGGFSGLAISQGIPSVSCDAGDKVISVLDADCNGDAIPVAGNMEWIRQNDARTISLGCDQGGDSLYDGGHLTIMCLRAGKDICDTPSCTGCSAPEPACGQTTSGTDSCNNPCTKTGEPCPGPTTPPAPTNLVVYAACEGINDAYVGLNWNDNSGKSTGYNIYRSTTSGFTPNAGNKIGTSTFTYYTDSAVSLSTTYYYKVRAYNTAGESSNSNEVSVTTGSCPPGPFDYFLSASASISIFPGSSGSNTITANLGIMASTTQPVSFSSSLVTGLPLGATASFSGALSCNPTCSKTLTISASPSTQIGTYFILVKSTSVGVPDRTAFFILVISLQPPTNLRATAGCEGLYDPTIVLAWDNNAGQSASGYNVYRSTTLGFTPSASNKIGTTTSTNVYVDHDVLPSTTYYYRVNAFNGAIESASSNEATSATGMCSGPFINSFLDIGLRAYDGEKIVKIAAENGPLTSPFRVSKGGVVYGIALVDLNDPRASNIKVETLFGPKAFMKLECFTETDSEFCNRLNTHCGIKSAKDNCGVQRNNVDCGLCSPSPPIYCVSGNCVCVPQCSGRNCGGDDCGGSCGTCTLPKTCQGGVCICTSTTCSAPTPSCGQITSGTDNCGDPCSKIGPSLTTCAAQGKNCGTISDGCGGTLNCGTCNSPKTCGGGGASGQANVCGCTPETPSALCTRLGKNCGILNTNNNCGTPTTVNCGTCTLPDICGGGGTNVCGTVPRVVVTFSKLATSLTTCTSSASMTYTIGEEIGSQYESPEGVKFSTTRGMSYGTTNAIVGGDTGASGNPILSVTTVDSIRCPVNVCGGAGTLTTVFVDPVTKHGVTVRNVAVHISDTEKTVKVQTYDLLGFARDQCQNVFSGCPYSGTVSGNGVNVQFTYGEIASIQFIDEDAGGCSDGFTMDDLSFDMNFAPGTA